MSAVRFRIEVRVGDHVTTPYRWEFVRPTRGEPYEMLTLADAEEFVRKWCEPLERGHEVRIVATRFASVNQRDGFTRVWCDNCTRIVELSRRELAGIYWYKIPRHGYWQAGGKV